MFGNKLQTTLVGYNIFLILLQAKLSLKVMLNVCINLHKKLFLFFTAQVEVYVRVVEVVGQQVQFRMERGTFTDFHANLELKDMGNGTLLAYTVQATPNIPIPSIFIQQAMNLELPANLCKMRQVLCNHK